jgi:hypothetical protein
MRTLDTVARAAGMLAVLWAADAAAADQPVLSAVRVSAAGTLADPTAAFWKSAPAVTVQPQGQMVATPTHAQSSISAMTVRAAHNGQSLAFLLEWADNTKDDRIVVDQFGDQVAVELPVRFDKDNPANPMMGSPEAMVTIMQWRAAFQRDIDMGRPPQLADLYPNAHVDVYPDQVLKVTDAVSYMGALTVGNPISRANTGPVLDQMAEGFGTLTIKPQQVATGKGVWSKGMWHVVISRPLKAHGAADPDLAPGAETSAAFAIWDGGAKEVGSRKGWADWVPVKLAK